MQNALSVNKSDLQDLFKTQKTSFLVPNAKVQIMLTCTATS